MLKDIFESLTKRLQALESFKDNILEALDDAMGDVDEKIISTIDECMGDFDEKLTSFINHQKADLLAIKDSIIQEKVEILAVKDDLLKEYEDFKNSFNYQEFVEEAQDIAVDVVQEGVESYLNKLKDANPELFAHRSKMIRHMEEFVAEKGYGRDWYKFYKTLRKQVV